PHTSSSSSPGLCTECKLVEVHGVKVASFSVDGQELICLPQVFDLFLKHLVGGLHTVYTKLKRLDISPVVCTVEQVRVLRGLGAIQPGVNRCKLISRKDFEVLYQDCTSSAISGSSLKSPGILNWEGGGALQRWERGMSSAVDVAAVTFFFCGRGEVKVIDGGGCSVTANY
uniref:SKI/SNO/DAC domain-containing protein n=1 Tax=Labrus bergylta TaxID=56723 RepID=A0A3Q3GT50_9LABR